MDSNTLEQMSLADLKALQVTVAQMIEAKTNTLRKEIKADALARAKENGIDPATLFDEPKKRTRKRRTKSASATE